MSGRPRVLLVDDDPSIRRLVELALEDLPIELVSCASVAQARAELRVQAAKLVITDLMMPVESGFDLLEALAADPALRAGAHLAVFSAGLNAPTRARLAGLGVWRELDKPVSISALEACVVDALALAPGPAAAAAPGTPSPGTFGVEERAAIDGGFGGDAALYAAFREQALQQFGADALEGDRALAAADWPALRRLVHSLKGVLALLGHTAQADHARALEAAAERGDAAACASGWPRLRADLLTRILQK
jgi:CheY-like chemotaxis protein